MANENESVMGQARKSWIKYECAEMAYSTLSNLDDIDLFLRGLEKVIECQCGKHKETSELHAEPSPFPEAKEVLERFSEPHGRLLKPRKFMQAIRIVETPARFNPAHLGDCAFTHSYSYNTDTRELTDGPSYSYDTMLSSGVNPTTRVVDVPANIRVWIVTYDGMWGGYWSNVTVYVHGNAKITDKTCEIL